MGRLRVIQWATGKVGTLSLRGILDDPRLELGGVYAYSHNKAGTDAGTLCVRPEIGISATTDIDELIALGTDPGLREVGLPTAPAGIWSNGRGNSAEPQRNSAPGPLVALRYAPVPSRR